MGYSSSVEFINCYNLGDIKGKCDYSYSYPSRSYIYIGGISGSMSDTMNGCGNLGEIDYHKFSGAKTNITCYIGGLIGSYRFNSGTKNCFNRGNVIGSGDSNYVGGIVGIVAYTSSPDILDNCYVACDKIGDMY